MDLLLDPIAGSGLHRTVHLYLKWWSSREALAGNAATISALTLFTRLLSLLPLGSLGL